MVRKEYIHETQLKLNSETDMIFFNSPNARCIFIMTPFRLNQHSCLLSESGNATFRSYVQTTCISN